VSEVVCRFSCGAASAVATKIAIDRYGDRVDVVNVFLAAEHQDNRRFLVDCERWFGRSITVLRDTKYDAEPVKVWLAKRFIASRHGAPCSKALKGALLDTYRPKETIVLGYTADEAQRLDRFIDANPELTVIAPLIEEGITKDDCFLRLANAGLLLPLPYRQGFKNSNCLKCPKGGIGYWNHLRRVYPENYEEVAQVQDLLGPGSYFLSDRRDGKRVRVSLRQLDPSAGRFDSEPPIECGGLCEMTDGGSP
jgi:hypothetical protein